MKIAAIVFAALVLAAAALVACRDLSRFKTLAGDRYEGAVVPADFVLTGVDPSTTLCMTIDTDHLQDAPGAISTSDGRFAKTPLRPIPQLWHDPLSTLAFGEGREKNLVYMAMPSSTFKGGGDTSDVVVVVSLMTNGDVEARMLRGAPGVDASAAAPSNVFAVFQLQRRDGPCSY